MFLVQQFAQFHGGSPLQLSRRGGAVRGDVAAAARSDVGGRHRLGDAGLASVGVGWRRLASVGVREEAGSTGDGHGLELGMRPERRNTSFT